MLHSATKLGFFGALALLIGKALYSLFFMLACVIGAAMLLGCLFAWYYVATSMGWLVL
jgi:hypothetical protein